MFLSSSSSNYALLCLVGLLWQCLLQPITARCFYMPPNATAQYESSPLVLKLQKASDDATTPDLPCPIRYYDDEQQTYTSSATGFPAYTILQIMKQEWSSDENEVPLAVGDSIVVVYSTDTGLRKAIPDSKTDDPAGFLAYLRPYTTCEEGGDVASSTAKDPFLMSECHSGNMKWSDVSAQDRAFLESMLVLNSNNDNTNTAEAVGNSSLTTNATIAVLDDEGGES